MCQALPSTHPCGHPSYIWSYCPESGMSGEGGAPPDCDYRKFARPATPSTSRCPLVHCLFEAGNSCRTCCQCGGKNSTGWCLHHRDRWERDASSGRARWVGKCEHSCCFRCNREGTYGRSCLKEGLPTDMPEI
ncbi:hypothetical protein B0H67DRAFT_484731 [Lasiosphaeris hirsuta]|uniref:Uncharacterized protein n=1 Tax=Lasiosphaeris hirsuta TaxID=260670 RepID=A0AA40AQU3_9PEZI|nr:hypothetical protein B0H67DRAFT_484731 [Lasiosphaeris hirsuta]